jgi:hypothetical protein
MPVLQRTTGEKDPHYPMTRKLTDEIYDLIPALIAEGKTKAEIAETYGVTTSTLQVQCCRRGISLRQGGPRIKLSLGLSDAALCALRMAAKARGKDETRLARDLLEAIAKDNLYGAVLDTRKEPIAA